MSPKRRALVASDSTLTRDPRVLKQIRWLIDDGWMVDTLGRGPQPPEVNGAHFKMPYRPFVVRVLANMFLPKVARFRTLVETTIPHELRGKGRQPKYGLAVLNEIELLPWFTRVRDVLVEAAPEGKAHLDLHEYAPSQRSGLLHGLLFSRYRLWQAGFVASDVFDSRSAVSPGIASLYSRHFAIRPPAIVRSVTDFVEQAPTVVDPNNIRLIHHGSAAAVRGLGLMIDAMADIDERFSLDLMLVGSRKTIRKLRNRAAHVGTRVTFRPPVDVREIASTLNNYDLEIIFFPPATENLRHALPNKLFEAIQGRVGIVLGQSPDMTELTTTFDNAVMAQGWSATDLAEAINGLTVGDIERLKAGSHAAADSLNSRVEGRQFFRALGK